jgi:predicted TIM-barrel fold metal-dependent hydrolase
MHKYKIIVFSSVFLLYGCSFLVKPVAGNFDGDPLDIADEISPQAMQLIQDAFSGFESEKLFDSHTHIIGLGAGDTGIWVNPEMQEGLHWIERLKFAIYKSASGIQHEENADQEYIERLVKLIDGMHPYNMKFFILAFDKHYNKAGEEDLSHTSFYVPNEYIVSLALQYPQFFVPVVSIHPYRKDALQALDKWHKQGVRYIKWLPNSQGIVPSDKDIIPFYKKMAEYNMVLITHTGEERAVEGEAFQRLGNPQLLQLPLQYGVTVIMAHLATLGLCEDLENAEREVSCFQLAIEMLEDKRYEKTLFADISAITQYNRTDKLEHILDKQSLHHRFINGSDYPLPAINFLYKTSQLKDMGFISENEKELLNEIYSYNPILFDFVLKRTIKSPGSGNKLLKDAFIFPDSI